MSLEDLEKELYGQRSHRPKKSAPAPREEKKDPFSGEIMETGDTPWQKNSAPAEIFSAGRSLDRLEHYGKMTLIPLAAVFLGLLAFSGVYLYQYFSVKDVALQISLPKEVMVGEAFQATVSFSNVSGKTLRETRISLSLPEGIVSLDEEGKRVLVRDVGDVSANTSLKEEFKLLMIGKSFSTHDIAGEASYRFDADTLSSRFEKRVVTNILSRESVLVIDLVVPEKVFSGEEFEAQVKYRNISNSSLAQAAVELEIPKEFTLGSAESAFVFPNLPLSELAAKGSGSAVFSGSLIGQEFAFFSVRAAGKIRIGSRVIEIVSKTASISIVPSPLRLTLRTDKNDPIIYPGETVRYYAEFSNESDVSLSDLVLSLQLRGEMYDFNSVESDGYFNNTTQTLAFTAANTPSLKQLEARSGGSVSFRIGTKTGYPITRLADKNFILKISGVISSSTVAPGIIADKTMGLALFEQKIGGQLDFSQKVYFNETTPGMRNIGALPPKAGSPIQYTVHWNLAARGVDFSGTKIKASLGPGIKWTGKVVSNIAAVPVYQERTQEVVWEVGDLNSGKGVIESGPNVVFQIEFIPAIHQIGTQFPLLLKTEVEGRDAFAGKEVRQELRMLESKDLSDFNLPSRYDRVVN